MSDYSSELENILNETRVNYGSNGISDEYEEELKAKLSALLRRVERGAHLSTPSDEMGVGGKQVGTLSELLINLSHSIEPSESIGLYYHSGLWGAEVQLDNSLKKRPLTPSAYGRNGHTPKEAVSNLVAALHQDKLIDLANTCPEATTNSANPPGTNPINTEVSNE